MPLRHEGLGEEKNMLILENVHKAYRPKRLLPGRTTEVKAVNGVSLEVKPGETLGFIGESGCGKSTLARVAVGLERPSAGEVFYSGINIHASSGNLKKVRKDLQIVFQDPYASLNGKLTIRQIINEPLQNFFKLVKGEEQEIVCRLLGDVGLPASIRFAYPHELSGGQRQRVALARAMALKPCYIVLDEPLASLDVSVQAQILNLLLDLKEKYNTAYIFISHDLRAVRYLCHRVAVMYRGRIVEILPAALLDQALHPYTRLLVSSSPGIFAYRDCNGGSAGVNIKEGANDFDIRGCSFAGHCPEAQKECFITVPDLVSHNNHQVACIKRGCS